MAVVLAISLCLIYFNVAHCWEFTLSTSSTYSYLYYSQLGPNGFFGSYDESSQADFAVANAWLGEGLGIVSGGDASLSSSSLYFYPTFYVNNAITISAAYRAGSAGTGAFPGAQVASDSGRWMQWHTMIESPMGIASYGKRPFGFGHGLQYDSTNRTEAHLALVTDYGPMQFGFGLTPSRGLDEVLPYRGADDRPFLMHWNPADKNGRPDMDIFAFMNYIAGPLEMGIGAIGHKEHVGPEGTIEDDIRDDIPTLDASSHGGWIYLHYSNGRFFLRTEADWFYRTSKFQKSQSGTFLPAQVVGAFSENTDGSGSIFKNLHTESWRYMVETGAIFGPAKVSFLYAFVPGPDRRHGVLIDRQPVIVNPYLPNFDRVIHHPDHGNAQVFRPYSTIFCSDFASGVGALDRSNEGYITDASVLAARLDFAVAANLNVYASFFKANRVSHGYGWGFITFDYPISSAYEVVYERIHDPNNTARPDFSDPSPAIPDNDLGWEATAGVDWKMLENFVITATAAYWQPGKWFNFACIDKGQTNWTNPDSTNMWGINPDRTIAGVAGFNLSVQVNF
jgi:hypothetical protein